MRGYHFRLASVARIRTIEESVARDRLMSALRELRTAQERERSANSALAGLEAPAGLVSSRDLQWKYEQAERLFDSVKRCRENVAEAASVAAERREDWNEASKRSQVLAKLESHAFAKWREDALHEEVSEIDDLTNARFAQGAFR